MKTSTNLSRRQFLKTSSSALAGATLFGVLPLERSAGAAGGDFLKIALVGCGGRGTAVAQMFAGRSDAEIGIQTVRAGDRAGHFPAQGLQGRHGDDGGGLGDERLVAVGVLEKLGNLPSLPVLIECAVDSNQKLAEAAARATWITRPLTIISEKSVVIR